MRDDPYNYYYVTFGSNHRRFLGPIELHQDAVLEVRASDYEEARKLVNNTIGTHWAFMYRAPHMDWSYYPAGVTCTLFMHPEVGAPALVKGRV